MALTNPAQIEARKRVLASRGIVEPEIKPTLWRPAAPARVAPGITVGGSPWNTGASTTPVPANANESLVQHFAAMPPDQRAAIATPDLSRFVQGQQVVGPASATINGQPVTPTPALVVSPPVAGGMTVPATTNAQNARNAAELAAFNEGSLVRTTPQAFMSSHALPDNLHLNPANRGMGLAEQQAASIDTERRAALQRNRETLQRLVNEGKVGEVKAKGEADLKVTEQQGRNQVGEAWAKGFVAEDAARQAAELNTPKPLIQNGQPVNGPDGTPLYVVPGHMIDLTAPERVEKAKPKETGIVETPGGTVVTGGKGGPKIIGPSPERTALTDRVSNLQNQLDKVKAGRGLIFGPADRKEKRRIGQALQAAKDELAELQERERGFRQPAAAPAQPAGRIRITRNGVPGTIDPKDFNPATDKRL